MAKTTLPDWVEDIINEDLDELVTAFSGEDTEADTESEEA